MRFSEVSKTAELGELGVSVYVFKARSRGQSVKETKQYVQREYFTKKACAPHCTVGCVQRISVIDHWRDPQDEPAPSNPKDMIPAVNVNHLSSDTSR